MQIMCILLRDISLPECVDTHQFDHFVVRLMFGQLTIVKVRDWYLDSFRDIRYFPEVRSRNDELAFTQMIKMIKVRHNNVVPTMALGVQQLKKELCHTRKVHVGFDEIHQFLDRFYLSRIGIRMLIGLHLSSYSVRSLIYIWCTGSFVLVIFHTVLV